MLADRGFAVLGSASVGADAVRMTAELQPDVVLLDLVLADGDSIPRIAEMLEAHPGVKVVVLSSSSDRDVVPALAARRRRRLPLQGPVALGPRARAARAAAGRGADLARCSRCTSSTRCAARIAGARSRRSCPLATTSRRASSRSCACSPSGATTVGIATRALPLGRDRALARQVDPPQARRALARRRHRVPRGASGRIALTARARGLHRSRRQPRRSDRDAARRARPHRASCRASSSTPSPRPTRARPVGLTDQPPFVNAAARLLTDLPLRDAAGRPARRREQELGRVRTRSLRAAHLRSRHPAGRRRGRRRAGPLGAPSAPGRAALRARAAARARPGAAAARRPAAERRCWRPCATRPCGGSTALRLR